MTHLPEVVAAYEQFKNKGLRMLSVSSDEPGREAKLRKVIADHRVTFPVIYDGKGANGPLAERNRVTGYPSVFLLDHRGRVRFTGLDVTELRRRVAGLLAERSAR